MKNSPIFSCEIDDSSKTHEKNTQFIMWNASSYKKRMKTSLKSSCKTSFFSKTHEMVPNPVQPGTKVCSCTNKITGGTGSRLRFPWCHAMIFLILYERRGSAYRWRNDYQIILFGLRKTTAVACKGLFVYAESGYRIHSGMTGYCCVLSAYQDSSVCTGLLRYEAGSFGIRRNRLCFRSGIFQWSIQRILNHLLRMYHLF